MYYVYRRTVLELFQNCFTLIHSNDITVYCCHISLTINNFFFFFTKRFLEISPDKNIKISIIRYY